MEPPAGVVSAGKTTVHDGFIVADSTRPSGNAEEPRDKPDDNAQEQRVGDDKGDQKQREPRRPHQRLLLVPALVRASLSTAIVR